MAKNSKDTRSANWSELTMSRQKSAGLVIVVPFLLALAGCTTHEQQDPRTQPELVRIVAVGAAPGGDPAFTGVVTARVQSDLGFRVPGKVTKRFVDVGQIVRAGQPLMRIDVTDYAHVITTQTQNVDAAKAKAVQAAADEARYRGLVSTGAVSASTYDQIKATADAAEAQLGAVEAQAQVAKDEGDYSLLVADAGGPWCKLWPSQDKWWLLARRSEIGPRGSTRGGSLPAGDDSSHPGLSGARNLVWRNRQCHGPAETAL